MTRNISEVNEFLEVEIENERTEIERSVQRMQNTFGWTRIDVLTMMVVCIFLASLCFSSLVEAFQTLIHLGHAGDTMHYTGYVLLVGIIGIALNVMVYYAIGGYTFHQGSFLSINEKGDVTLDTVISGERYLREGRKRLSCDKTIQVASGQPVELRQNLREMIRDVCSKYYI